jgi:RNA-directed DNA polymerase
MLSNALCYELDEQLTVLATRNAVTYTRYADDLFFSTQHPNVLRRVQAAVPGICADLVCPANLAINPAKTRHSSRIGARRVTGITLGSDGRTYLGRAVKRRIRAMIFRLDALSDREKASLRGWVAYAGGIDPDFLNSLIAKYGLPLVRRSQNR